MLCADLFPVAREECLVHARVAGRVDVSETWNGAVGSRKIGAVDNNLVTREDAQRIASGAIHGSQASE